MNTFDLVLKFGLIVGGGVICSLLAYYLLHKLKLIKQPKNSLIKFKSSYALSPRDKVVLLQVDNQNVLLGVGLNGIQALTPFVMPEKFSQKIVQQDSKFQDMVEANQALGQPFE